MSDCAMEACEVAVACARTVDTAGDSCGSDGAEQGPIVLSVRALLHGIGENCQREGLRSTPERVARALEYSSRGYRMTAAEAMGSALFHEPLSGTSGSEATACGPGCGCGAAAPAGAAGAAAGAAGHPGGMVLVRGIDVFSTSESDLIPFQGALHVAYIPAGGRIVGLSKLARIAEVFARRLQAPGRLARELAGAVQELVRPHGVAVVLRSRQLSEPGMPLRAHAAATGCFLHGAEASGAMAAAEGPGAGAGAAGELADSAEPPMSSWEEFLLMLGADSDGCPPPQPGCAPAHGPPAGPRGPLAARASPEAPGTPPLGAADGPGGTGTIGADETPALSAGGPSSGAAGAAVSPALLLLGGASGAGAASSLGGPASPLHAVLSTASMHDLLMADGPGALDAQRGGAAAGTDRASSEGGWDEGACGCAPCEARLGVDDLVPSAGAEDPDAGPAAAAAAAARRRSPVARAAMQVAAEELVRQMQADAGAPAPGGPARADGPGAAASAAGYVAAFLHSTRGYEQSLEGLLHEAGWRSPPPATGAPAVAAGSAPAHYEFSLRLASQCEHHLLPFYGIAHVAYCGAPGGPAPPRLRRELLESIAGLYGSRLQVQERLTRQLAAAVRAATGAAGVMVVVECSHLCMLARGVQKTASKTATDVALGTFAASGAARRAFLRARQQAEAGPALNG